jgi:hypothetical protein
MRVKLRDVYAVSRFPSFNSFCENHLLAKLHNSFPEYPIEKRTKAFIVPCRACLWFLRNFGSVPFRDGYLEVFGFLILFVEIVSVIHDIPRLETP